MTDPAMPSRILVVCTGNICRSPAAALLLGRRTDDTVTVGSAGTAAVVGHDVSAPMAALLQERGVDTAGFAARAVTAAMVAEAALVVTMTREQRSHVVRLDPRAVRRTFTLLELATLLADAPVTAEPTEDDATRLSRLPDLAASRRGLVLTSRTPLDVPDPFGRPERVYRRTLAAIEPAVEKIARAVHPPSASLGSSWSPHAARAQRKATFPDGSDGPGDAGDAGPGKGRLPRHGVRRRLF
jgi:protein-tyrosine phosphatase